MDDYRLQQTGPEVQNILNGAAMKVDLDKEVLRAKQAEQTLQGNIDSEEDARKGADHTLQQNIDLEEARAKNAEETNAGDIADIESKIPNQASSTNQLADKEFVNSSIANSTATFRGTYNLLLDLELPINATHEQIAAALSGVINHPKKNEYCFVQIPTTTEAPTQIAKIERYKYSGSVWEFEYDLNNSTFTTEQWAAINSGITTGLVTKLGQLPTASELAAALLGKQDVLQYDELPISGSQKMVKSGGIYTAIKNSSDALEASIEAILAMIPSAASALNQLADKAFVNSSISTATATFRGTFNLVTDLELGLDATHEEIAIAIGGLVTTADNNDYCFVQTPTSAETPTEIAKTSRYKFNGSNWAFEYDLNTSGFTAAQWEAINSGATADLISKLGLLPTNAELTAMFEAITSLIPSEATTSNQLADKAYVDESISTAAAIFRGTYNLVTNLELGLDATHAEIATAIGDVVATADINDYCFVLTPTSVSTPTEIAKTSRYKFNGSNWAFEYDLNTSGFTAEQWAAINSGITSGLIPSEATVSNKLADKAYVLARIIAAIPAFKGQFVTLTELQAVASPKAGDLGIVRTKDSDGYDVFTFYQYLNNAWNVFYTLSHHPKIKPATTGTTGDYPYNGMGRVVIPKNMQNIAEEGEPENIVNLLTQAAFEDGEGNPLENTVFVIQYDFTLDEDITVPANCVLEFDGGSLNGSATITFQNTELYGNYGAIATSLNLAGTIEGVVDIGYWKLKSGDNVYDNGAVINKVCGTFKKVYIPAMELYFSTPISVTGMKTIRCDAKLRYNGTQTNVSAIKILTSSGEFQFNDEITCNSTLINYTEANNSKIRGLEVCNVNGSVVTIFYIGQFNEGLRVSDTIGGNTGGCSYNTFNLGLIVDCNFGVRIHQANGGWCNQNLFLGGRITHFSGWDYHNPSWCVFAYGAQYESGYDPYNGVNNLTFIGTSVEDFYGIYFKNVQYTKLYGIRHDGSSHPLKLTGESCFGIEWNYSYPPKPIDATTDNGAYADMPEVWGDGKVDVTESNYTGISVKGQVPVITDTVKPSSGSVIVEIDTTIYRAFTANLFAMGRPVITYLEDVNGVLDTIEKKKQYPAIGGYDWNNNDGSLDPQVNVKGIGNRIFFVPEGITKISIEFWNNVGGTYSLFDL